MMNKEINLIPPAMRKGLALLGVAASFGALASPASAEYNPQSTDLPSAIGEKTLAMVLVNFEGQPSAPYTKETVQKHTFDAPGSLADLYSKASFGKMTLTGEVFGPVTVKQPSLAESCDDESLLSVSVAANKAVVAQTGRDLKEFDNYAYNLPRVADTKNCNLGGITYGNISFNLETRKKFNLPVGKFYTGVVAHEYGHNLGLSHANKISCREDNRPVAFNLNTYLNNGCKSLAYKDPMDPMGWGQVRVTTPPDFSALNKARLGWLKPENTVTVKDDSEITIAPLELESDKPQLVRVANGLKVNGDPHYFYLDYRQPIGLDSNLKPDDPAVTGISIREASSIHHARTPFYDEFTNFIDTTPETGQTADGTLGAGRTFKDTSTGITIKTLRTGPEGATVRISGVN
jgi:Metallo-peptidase family M12B Reprolysin-like